MKHVAVIILNWNGKHWLESFLNLVVERSPGARVIVADNGSSDNSQSWVAANAPSVEWLGLGSNHGYAGGYNRALSEIKDVRYAVLMNSDIEPLEGWLAPLVDRMDASENLAAIQPKILDHKRPDHFEYAGAAGGYMDALAYPFAAGRVMSHIEKDHGQYDTVDGQICRKVFWASGACLMVRVSAYQQAGGLDEQLFAHMEEIDLCWRMQLHGYSIEAHGGSSVLHVGGGTLNALSPQKTFLNFRNSLLIVVKNLPTGSAMRILAARLFLDGLAGLVYLRQGKGSHCWAIVRAHRDFYRLFSSFSLRPNAKKGWPSNGRYKGSILWDVYVKKQMVIQPSALATSRH